MPVRKLNVSAYRAQHLSFGHIIPTTKHEAVAFERLPIPPGVGRRFAFFAMPQLKSFHVVSVKLLIEQQHDDEGRAVSELAEVAIEAACNLLEHITGRETRQRAMVLEPLRLIEPAKKEQDDK